MINQLRVSFLWLKTHPLLNLIEYEMSAVRNFHWRKWVVFRWDVSLVPQLAIINKLLKVFIRWLAFSRHAIDSLFISQFSHTVQYYTVQYFAGFYIQNRAPIAVVFLLQYWKPISNNQFRYRNPERIVPSFFILFLFYCLMQIHFQNTTSNRESIK